jgi:uncharacterized protein (TIGR01777 family)
MMKRHILITGATGMIGKGLINVLMKKNYSVSILSRSKSTIEGVTGYLWDPDREEIDADCLKGVDTIIHLAGESVASKKWTEARKQDILNSRVGSTDLLHKLLETSDHTVANFISASAVGYYGDREDEILKEDSGAGSGFLADCCQLWENAVDKMDNLGLRVAKIRIGVVLDKAAGALPELEKPIKFFVGAPLGSGNQWIPWIYLHDLVQIFVHVVDNNELSGAFNACAPNPITNKTLTKAVAKNVHRPVWPFGVPESVMKMILGEMSQVVLASNNTSAEKLISTGFFFKFTHLEDALKDIYK